MDEAGVEMGRIEVAKNKLNDIRHKMDKKWKAKQSFTLGGKKLLESVSLTLMKIPVFPSSETLLRKDKKEDFTSLLLSEILNFH